MELERVENEMRLYVTYLNDLCALCKEKSELKTQMLTDSYNVSSPRIKSSEEAKYKESPKVFTIDSMLNYIEKNTERQKKIEKLNAEIKFKMEFCNRMMSRIYLLEDEEIEILGYRYFQCLTFREIAHILNYQLSATFYKVDNILSRLSNFENVH